jgi:hypothetical protein
MKKPLAYSYSLFNAFETCPRQCNEVRVLKNFVEPETEYSRWGNYVHKCMEDRVGKRAALPENVRHLESLAAYLESLPGTNYVELALGIDEDFAPVDFFAKNVWFRGKVDLLHKEPCQTIGTAYDYKTGKPVKDSVQLMDMALLSFIHYPELETIKAVFVFLKFDDVATEVFKRSDMPHMMDSLMQRTKAFKKAFDSNTWYPRPSGLCKRHCVVTTCEYNGRRTPL